MKIFKFGGASVKNANAVKNLYEIVKSYKDEKLVLVISAMGKTTNAAEKIIGARWNKEKNIDKLLQPIFDYHDEIVSDLFNKNDPFFKIYSEQKSRIKAAIELPLTENYDFEYDRIVYFGEILSTRIVSAFLNSQELNNTWLDARKLIRTNNNYREGNVLWEETKELVSSAFKDVSIGIVQGFIGATSDGYVTTLGREGSDFSAAIMAWCLDAESVSIWKDVPGMLNADPKYFPDAEKLDQISYREALELSYYGASVIHPKTIKPLRNKGIPLYVRSFLDVNETGSVIHASDENDTIKPSYIFKKDQVLISISTKDLSFVVEENLENIFGIFNRHKVRINLMQNSAINFTVCSDSDPHRIGGLIKELSEKYRVLYNEGMELLTVRHYNEDTIERVIKGKKILVDQRSRVTARMVVKDN